MKSVDVTLTSPSKKFVVVKYTPVEDDADAEQVVYGSDRKQSAIAYARRRASASVTTRFNSYFQVIRRDLVRTETDEPTGMTWFEYSEEQVWP